MNAARRIAKRRNWPRGLYEVSGRPGYYYWRHPTTGKGMAIGYVPLAVAINQTLQANAFVAEQKPGLLDRLSGAAHTVADLLREMPKPAVANTEKTLRVLDKKIVAAIGGVHCSALTTMECAKVVEPVIKEGKLRTAQALRTRLVAMCKRGQQLGWLDHNPAEPVATVTVKTTRERLTLEAFKAIYAAAPKVSPWLQRAMMLSVLTGADRSSVASWTQSNVVGDHLVFQRSKSARTNRPIAIPLDIRLNVLGVSLRDVLAERTGVLSPYLLHHTQNHGNAPAGSPVFVDRISKTFAAARDLAGLVGENPVTFHEIRSLAARLYKEQGGVDVKTLLSHKDDKSAALYQDDRSALPVYVRVTR